MLVIPARPSRAIVLPERLLRLPTIASGTTIMQSPSDITQASVEEAPISRLELEAQRAEMAKHRAAPMPPTTAISTSLPRADRGGCGSDRCLVVQFFRRLGR